VLHPTCPRVAAAECRERTWWEVVFVYRRRKESAWQHLCGSGCQGGVLPRKKEVVRWRSPVPEGPAVLLPVCQGPMSSY